MLDRRLNALERFCVWGMGTLGQFMEGYQVPFLEDVVRAYGLRKTMAHFAELGRLIALLEEQLGFRDAHVLIGYASLWNGCQFCSVGHLYAASLFHFEETEQLFPLDERSLPKLLDMRDTAVLQHTQAQLQSEEFTRIRGLLERMFALRGGAVEGDEEEDALLLATLAAYDWLNRCSVINEGDLDAIPALGNFKGKEALKRRYHEARQTARSA